MEDTMTKYIDADKLKSIIKAQIKERKEWMKDIDRSDRQDQLWSDLNGEDISILQIIGSLQKEQRKLGVFVPEWCLENIQDTLRIQYNINSDKATGETCQDRNIKESLNELQKILNGEELTGMERLEPLKQKQQEVDLEKEINRYCGPKDIRPVPDLMDSVARHFYELGRNSK